MRFDGAGNRETKDSAYSKEVELVTKQRRRAIDIHTHLATSGPVPSDEELERAVCTARHYGIRHLVLLGNLTAMGGPDPTIGDISAINTHTLGAMERYPGVYVGFCYLNPSHPVSFLREEIDRCVMQGGMRGLKLWIAVKATDPRLDPIMEAAGELGVPVLHHAWYKQTVYAYNESTPAEIAHLAGRFPQVQLVMAHLTGCGPRGVLDIAEHPNVLIDTSGGQPETGLVEYAVRHLGSERVVFGSDWPLRDFGTQLGRIIGSTIAEEELENILWKNAARLLRLEEN